MTKVLATASGLFRDRDFFVHDGTQLRRFRLSASIQIVCAAALLKFCVKKSLTPSAARMKWKTRFGVSSRPSRLKRARYRRAYFALVTNGCVAASRENAADNR